jgi:hypothetical protein
MYPLYQSRSLMLSNGTGGKHRLFVQLPHQTNAPCKNRSGLAGGPRKRDRYRRPRTLAANGCGGSWEWWWRELYFVRELLAAFACSHSTGVIAFLDYRRFSCTRLHWRGAVAGSENPLVFAKRGDRSNNRGAAPWPRSAHRWKAAVLPVRAGSAPP